MTITRNITCHINGQDQILPDGTTLIDFLNSKDVPVAAVVVEYNKEILPKGQYDGIVLSDGDMLEVIQIIGGG